MTPTLPPAERSPWYTITQAAEYLGVYRQTVWSAIRRHGRGAPGLRARAKRLPGDAGFVYLIHIDELFAYRRRLRGRVAKPGPKPGPKPEDG